MIIIKKIALIVLASLFITVLSAGLIIRANKLSQSMTIVIDPGHGGFDGGASSRGVNEKDITLKLSLLLKGHLTMSGFNVILTRETDSALAHTKASDIKKRVSLINGKADLYLSIHVNKFPDASVQGAQTFYNQNNDQSKVLAETLQEYLKYLDIKNHRVAKKINGIYLVDHVSVTGCLVEVGFISNPQDFELLSTHKYLEQLAYTISTGIIVYLANNP